MWDGVVGQSSGCGIWTRYVGYVLCVVVPEVRYEWSYRSKRRTRRRTPRLRQSVSQPSGQHLYLEMTRATFISSRDQGMIVGSVGLMSGVTYLYLHLPRDMHASCKGNILDDCRSSFVRRLLPYNCRYLRGWAQLTVRDHSQWEGRSRMQSQ